MAAVTICSDFGAPKNKGCHCFHCFPIYLPRSDISGLPHFLSFASEPSKFWKLGLYGLPSCEPLLPCCSLWRLSGEHWSSHITLRLLRLDHSFKFLIQHSVSQNSPSSCGRERCNTTYPPKLGWQVPNIHFPEMKGFGSTGERDEKGRVKASPNWTWVLCPRAVRLGTGHLWSLFPLL